MGAQLLLSNSDPKNTVPDDDFFDDLYAAFRIERVRANRAINSDASKRGKISELLIRNYGAVRALK
jgi:DNA adenine methylase